MPINITSLPANSNPYLASQPYYQSVEAANQANEARYQQILAGYQGQLTEQQGFNQANQRGYAQMLTDVQGLGASQRRDIEEQFARQGAESQQSMISRGMGNTTVLDSAARGIGYDNARANIDLQDQLTRQQMEITGARLQAQQQGQQLYSGIQGNRLGFMNSRTENPINAGDYIGLQQLQMQQEQANFERSQVPVYAPIRSSYGNLPSGGQLLSGNPNYGGGGGGGGGGSMGSGSMAFNDPIGYGTYQMNNSVNRNNPLDMFPQMSPGGAGQQRQGGGAADNYGYEMGANKGGKVPGRGNTDTVRARLTPGEFVLSKKMIADVMSGKMTMAQLKKKIKQPAKAKTGYAEGGTVLENPDTQGQNPTDMGNPYDAWGNPYVPDRIAIDREISDPGAPGYSFNREETRALPVINPQAPQLAPQLAPQPAPQQPQYGQQQAGYTPTGWMQNTFARNSPLDIQEQTQGGGQSVASTYGYGR